MDLAEDEKNIFLMILRFGNDLFQLITFLLFGHLPLASQKHRKSNLSYLYEWASSDSSVSFFRGLWTISTGRMHLYYLLIIYVYVYWYSDCKLII